MVADSDMLEQVLYHIHNWFVVSTASLSGCEIEGGRLPESVASSIIEGQWYRIEGSVMNDGLHQHPSYDLVDETFSGTMSLLAIPKALLSVADEIAEWVEDTKEADRKARKAPYSSESFGGYTYSMKGDSRSSGASGGLSGWQAAFASDLNPFRKIS